ncbi:MAG: RNA-processing protein [Candidatus Methanomethylicota archaeon]|uniref:RNA-processing protein n=1 Tax=Thermoproteota archaeon TaxID=2056631 RepID=A0A497EX84_9CREN|nr:MAG: RNA-processing protein [Candidatus Verstraetearchaeota archaeon]
MGEGGAPIVRDYVNVPSDRIGVIIGNKGMVKREIEARTGIKVYVDTSSCSVTLELDPSKATYEDLLKAKNVILAIAHGFSPERAFRLMDEDQILDIIDLTQYAGSSRNALTRIKGRIIGEKGKTRRIIEEHTGTYISVYENTVAIIGEYERVRIARHAIEMLANGAQHRTVYSYLHREARRLKREEFMLWRKY